MTIEVGEVHSVEISISVTEMKTDIATQHPDGSRLREPTDKGLSYKRERTEKSLHDVFRQLKTKSAQMKQMLRKDTDLAVMVQQREEWMLLYEEFFIAFDELCSLMSAEDRQVFAEKHFFGMDTFLTCVKTLIENWFLEEQGRSLFFLQPPSYRSYYSDEEDSQGQRTLDGLTPPPSYRSSYSDEGDSQGRRTLDGLTPVNRLSPITKVLRCNAVRRNNRIVTANSPQTLVNIPGRFVLEQPGTNNTSSAPKRRRKCRVRFSCRACIIVSLVCYWLGSTIAPALTIRDILLHPQRNDTTGNLKPSVGISILAAGYSRLPFNYMWVGYCMLSMCNLQTDDEDDDEDCFCPMCFMFIMCTLLSFGFSANYLFRNSVEARWVLAGTDITLSFALALLLLALLIDYCRKKRV